MASIQKKNKVSRNNLTNPSLKAKDKCKGVYFYNGSLRAFIKKKPRIESGKYFDFGSSNY